MPAAEEQAAPQRPRRPRGPAVPGGSTPGWSGSCRVPFQSALCRERRRTGSLRFSGPMQPGCGPEPRLQAFFGSAEDIDDRSCRVRTPVRGCVDPAGHRQVSQKKAFELLVAGHAFAGQEQPEEPRKTKDCRDQTGVFFCEKSRHGVLEMFFARCSWLRKRKARPSFGTTAKSEYIPGTDRPAMAVKENRLYRCLTAFVAVRRLSYCTLRLRGAEGVVPTAGLVVATVRSSIQKVWSTGEPSPM